MDTKFRLCADTHPGRVRQNNEDKFLINIDLGSGAWDKSTGSTPVGLGSLGTLLVVADGMGGANAGEVASQIAIQTIRDEFTTNAAAFAANPENALKRLLQAANTYIVRAAAEGTGAKGMGTTCVIAWVLQDKAHIAWVGDSRAYLFHPRTGLRQLSKDHSFVQELVDAGKLTPEQAFYHPEGHIITQSLGDTNRSVRPDYVCEPMYNNDMLLLCSDGLCGLVQDREIEGIFRQSTDIAQTQRTLIDAANEAGGSDNITVALAEFYSAATRPESAPPAQRMGTGMIASAEPAHPGRARARQIPLPSFPAESKPRDQRVFILLLAGILIALIAIAILLFSDVLKKETPPQLPPATHSTSTGTPNPVGKPAEHPADTLKVIKDTSARAVPQNPPATTSRTRRPAGRQPSGNKPTNQTNGSTAPGNDIIPLPGDKAPTDATEKAPKQEGTAPDGTPPKSKKEPVKKNDSNQKDKFKSATEKLNASGGSH